MVECCTDIEGYFTCSNNNLIELVGVGKCSGVFYCEWNPIAYIYRLFRNKKHTIGKSPSFSGGLIGSI